MYLGWVYMCWGIDIYNNKMSEPGLFTLEMMKYMYLFHEFLNEVLS